LSAAASAQNAPSRVQAWKLAVRLPTLTAAIAPVAVGTGAAIADRAFSLWPMLAALFGAICLQIGANFANDVFDFKRGADTADRLGPPRATQMGLLSPREMLTGMWVVFALAFLAGIYLVYVGGLPIVAVGLASIVAAIIYTGGPWPIGYHALGDLFTFVFFGLVAVMGTYYVQAGEVTWLSLVAAIPMGCTVTLILVVNNLRDIPTDRATGKTTLGVVMGQAGTRKWFAFLLAVALLVPVAALALEVWWGWVASLIAAPFAVKLLRAILGCTEGRALNPVLKATARFNLLFGLLWAAALAVS
jgi:1,4-dihydroxy-2-naphthoate octaprenyltransferase